MYSLAYELTAPIYPTGACCRNILPLEPKGSVLGLKEATEKTIDSVNFRELKKGNNSDNKDKGFIMYLKSREVSNKYFMDKFTINGVDLRVSSDISGYILYEVQMYKKIDLGGKGSLQKEGTAGVNFLKVSLYRNKIRLIVFPLIHSVYKPFSFRK